MQQLQRFLVVTGMGALLAAAQAPSAARLVQQVARTRTFTEIAMSPDGNRVAWVEEIRHAGVDTGNSVIHVRSVTAGAPEATVAAQPGHAASEHDVAWSPDGRWIAFLSDAAETGQLQLYIAPASGGPARQLTHLHGYLTDPGFSPDGEQLAFLFAQNAPSGGGPLHPEPVETGVIGGAIHNQRLALVGRDGSAIRQLTPVNLNVYEYDWQPNGRGFAFTAAPRPGDDNWWIAQLYQQSLTKDAPRLVFRNTDAQAQLAMPRWSPDGQTIALIEGLMSDEGFTGGDLATVNANTGAVTLRTQGSPVSVSSLTWLSDGALGLTEYVGGSSQVVRFPLGGRPPRVLWQSGQNVHVGGNFGNFSWSRDGQRAALIAADWQHPPEIVAGIIGHFQPLTQANAGLAPAWGKSVSVEWTRGDQRIQGWLLYPRSFDPARRYPMVVSVHGGPANLNQPHWPDGSFEPTLLAGLGYFVFFPNPRGSYGQGEAFTRANVKDFGYGDLQDILAGVDKVLTTVPVDPQRLGITGWSYGGYMTMWAVTQTGRFKAAVSGAGLSDWLSYYGENSIDRWMIPYFGASVYDDPAVYSRSAPMTYIKQVHTPTLVVVGERDGECPAPQSYEFWRALQVLGVPTQLVVYPGEGHLFQQSRHIQDVMSRTLEWFNHYLSAGTP